MSVCVSLCQLCAEAPRQDHTQPLLPVQMARAFLEVDEHLDPEVKAVVKEKAQAHVAGVLAAVDVDKYIKVRATNLILKLG